MSSGMMEIEDSFLPVLIVTKDIINSCNHMFSTLVGISESELINRSLHEHLHLDGDVTSAVSNISLLLNAASVSETGCFVKATLMDVNFHRCKVELHCQRRSESQFDNTFKLCFNVIENKSIDSITGLPNGWAISARATYLFKLPNTQMRLMMLSVDNFSTINFRYGFDTGDNYLSVLGKKLQATVSDDGLVVRLANARYGILIENKHHLSSADFNAYITMFCQYLCDLSLGSLVLNNGIRVNKSFSIGISCEHTKYESYFAMENATETAMKESRRHSHSYYCFAKPEIKPELMANKFIIDELPSAIEKSLIKIHYQPQYDLTTKQLVGFEALSRWIHKDLGYIPPDVFIRIVEDIGLHFEFDLWVFTQVCNQVVEWQKSGISTPKVAINISFKTLEMIDFIYRLEYIIASTGCPKDLLEIEVTETASISNMDTLINNIRAVRSLGILVAIDDFGSGYSSLSLVRKLRKSLNTLKIDRSLVADICESTLDKEFARKIIELGKVLNVKVLAEGVETLAQRDLLQTLGCDYAQGYYFDKALSMVDAENLIINQARN